MVVTILRGLPGSGKSACCKDAVAKLPDTVVCSADDFFMVDGEYKFNKDLIGQAHASCLLRFAEALRSRPALILIDNTNIRAVEIAPYYALAQAYSAKVEIVTFVCSVETAVARNIHGASAELVQEMDELMKQEDASFPPWWNRSWRITG